jgi:Acetyltransferase (GNAT) family
MSAPTLTKNASSATTASSQPQYQPQPSSAVHNHSHRTWTRDGFLISTDSSLIPLASINEAFGSDALYWAKPLPEEALRVMLEHSLSFGVYAATGKLPPSTEGEDGMTGVDGSGMQSMSETIHEIAMKVRPQEHSQGEQRDTQVQTRTQDQDQSQNQTQPSTTPNTSSEPDSESTPELIGFARCITDHITFLYLTDVYILPVWQGQGLGKWLIQCVQDVVEGMEWLRRVMALTGGDDTPVFADGGERREKGGLLGFYEREMGMREVTKGHVISASGRGCTF